MVFRLEHVDVDLVHLLGFLENGHGMLGAVVQVFLAVHAQIKVWAYVAHKQDSNNRLFVARITLHLVHRVDGTTIQAPAERVTPIGTQFNDFGRKVPDLVLNFSLDKCRHVYLALPLADAAHLGLDLSGSLTLETLNQGSFAGLVRRV